MPSNELNDPTGRLTYLHYHILAQRWRKHQRSMPQQVFGIYFHVDRSNSLVEHIVQFGQVIPYLKALGWLLLIISHCVMTWDRG